MAIVDAYYAPISVAEVFVLARYGSAPPYRQLTTRKRGRQAGQEPSAADAVR